MDVTCVGPLTCAEWGLAYSTQQLTWPFIGAEESTLRLFEIHPLRSRTVFSQDDVTSVWVGTSSSIVTHSNV